MNNSLNPKDPARHFALIQVEVRSGAVLTVEGARYTGQGERFLFFEALDSAKERSQQIVRLNPEIECIIQDDRNHEIVTVRDEDYVRAILEQSSNAKQRQRKWWKFW